jgi:hypothetical protein
MFPREFIESVLDIGAQMQKALWTNFQKAGHYKCRLACINILCWQSHCTTRCHRLYDHPLSLLPNTYTNTHISESRQFNKKLSTRWDKGKRWCVKLTDEPRSQRLIRIEYPPPQLGTPLCEDHRVWGDSVLRWKLLIWEYAKRRRNGLHSWSY